MTLMRLDPGELPAWMGKLDRLAGNLSYPIYLCHFGVAIVLTWLIPGLTRKRAWVFLIGFPIVNLVAYLIYHHVERPLQSWKLSSLVQDLPARSTTPRPVVRDGKPTLVHASHPAAGLKSKACTSDVEPT